MVSSAWKISSIGLFADGWILLIAHFTNCYVCSHVGPGSAMTVGYPNASEHLMQKPFRNTNPNNSTKLRDPSSPQHQQQHSLHSRLVVCLSTLTPWGVEINTFRSNWHKWYPLPFGHTQRSVQQDSKHQPQIGRNISAMLNENNTVVCYLEPLPNS